MSDVTEIKKQFAAFRKELTEIRKLLSSLAKSSEVDEVSKKLDAIGMGAGLKAPVTANAKKSSTKPPHQLPVNAYHKHLIKTDQISRMIECGVYLQDDVDGLLAENEAALADLVGDARVNLLQKILYKTCAAEKKTILKSMKAADEEAFEAESAKAETLAAVDDEKE
jgi:hypothetical protein